MRRRHVRRGSRPIRGTCSWSIFTQGAVLKCIYPIAAKSELSEGACIFHRILADGPQAVEHARESLTSTPAEYIEKARKFTYGERPEPKPVKPGNVAGVALKELEALARKRGRA